jgi:NADH-ubiquinone oxidoreductase chain 5
MFHLFNHAFFKALLFLTAGVIIHALADEQDMRKMGGLKNTLPFTYSVILIGSLALTGFPFLAGFYSKDIILEVAAMTYTNIGQFAYLLGLLAAFCTAFYSMRLLFLVFLSNPNGNKKVILNVHEGTWRMTLPLFLLGLLSIFIGYLTKDLFIGFGNYFWNTSIFILPKNYTMSDIEFLNIEFKLLPLIITLLGLISAYYVYAFGVFDYFQLKTNKTFKALVTYFNKKWYFDRIYNEFIVQKILKSSYYYFYQDVDRGLIEKIGPSGISENINVFAQNIKYYQTGQVLNYLTYFAFFALLIILISNKSYFILLLSIGSLIVFYYSANKSIIT